MENQPADIETLRLIKHDVKNQLSNIHLALETLKYELSDPTDDVKFYMDTISVSAKKINDLIQSIA